MTNSIDREERNRGSNFSSMGFLFIRRFLPIEMEYPHKMTLHQHEWHEFIITGTGRQEKTHQLKIAGENHLFKTNCLIYIPAFHLHQLTINAPLEQWVMGIDSQQLLKLFDRSPIITELKNIINRWNNLPAISDINNLDTGASTTFRDFFSMFPNQGTQKSLDSLCFLRDWNQLLEALIPEHQNGSLDKTENSDIFQRTLAYLEENYAHGVGVPECADHLDISRSTLSHKFKQQSGYSVPQMLTQIRLRHAQSLLMDTTMDISSIALDCGFRDSSWFYRQFKQIMGISPTQWRVLHKEP